MAITTHQLFRAIHIDDQAAVKRALSLNPALVHAKHPRDAYTPLHLAAASGNLPLLKELLHQGASCQSCAFNNETPLHVAARQGHLSIVKELLGDAGRRFCLRSSNKDGATPLHLAAAAGHTDVVQMLLNAGARGDLKDRAGRTPLDLVNAEHPELAEILLMGRQLTPGRGARSRRIISPGVSPTPFQNMRAASPSKLAVNSSQLQQQESDTKAAADTTVAGANAGLTADLPRSMNTVITSGDDGMAEEAYAERQLPPAVCVGQHDQGPQTLAECDRDTHKENHEQCWLQYSPQRPVNGTFRVGQQKHQSNCQRGKHQRDVTAAPAGSRSDILQSPTSARRSPMKVLQPGLAGNASDTLSESASEYPRQQRGQQQQQPSSQLGPLHSARAAGPMAAGAAAAAAVNDLTKSFEYHPTIALTANASRPTAVGPLMQQTSTLPGPGGVSHIVSPEASSGLLAGPLLTPQHSSKDLHAASATTAQPTTMHYPAHDSFENSSGILSIRKSVNQLPSGVLRHPSSQQHAQLPLQAQHSQQQQQLAALAASVSASSRIGPFQLPVQSQLNELSNKVYQLEQWFEAQVELIPEWQKVLTVVQGVKRQVEGQKHDLLDLETKSQGHGDSQEHLAMQLAKIQGAQASTGSEVTQLRSDRESLKWTLGGINEQIRQLESQLVHQASTAAARMGTTDSLVASVSAGVAAVTERLSTLENTTKSIESQLHTAQQQVTVSRPQRIEADEATRESAAGSNATASRIAVLESSMAEMRQMLQELQQAKQLAGQGQPVSSPAATQTESVALQEQPVSGQSANPAAALQTEQSYLLDEVDELKQRVSDLSVCVSSMDYTAALQAPAVEATILPFMETTSNCLQQHEQQLDAIQAVVPKLESVAAQRARMCELMQQVAALQTAFNMLTGSKGILGGRSTSGVLSAGPLSTQKAAADYLALSTNMVNLQGQMGALSSAVEDLHNDWEHSSAAMKAEHEAIRSAWDAERSRMSAAEREAVRRLADQQKGLEAREQKLIEIREAAIAEEAAKNSQLESESRVSAAIDNMMMQQQAMRTKVTQLTEAGEATTAATKALKQQMDNLQASMAHLRADLQPRIEQIDASNIIVDRLRREFADVKALEAKMEPSVRKVNALKEKLEASKPSIEHVRPLDAKVQATTPQLEHMHALEDKVKATKADVEAVKARVEGAKAEAAAANRTSTFAAAKVTAARASAFAASVSSPMAGLRSEPAGPSLPSDRDALVSFAALGASTTAVNSTPQLAAGSIRTQLAAAPSAEADNPFLSSPLMSLLARHSAATTAEVQSESNPAPATSPSSYLYRQQQVDGRNSTAPATSPSAGSAGSAMFARSKLEPAGVGVGKVVPPMPAVGAETSDKADDIQQVSPAQTTESFLKDIQVPPSKHLSWFSKTRKRKCKHAKMADVSELAAPGHLHGVANHDASTLLPRTEALMSGEPVAAAASKHSKWAKRWQRLVQG